MHSADPLYPLKSAVVRGNETRGIPMPQGECFAADMCRDEKMVYLADRERPSVPCERHDVDTLR